MNTFKVFAFAALSAISLANDGLIQSANANALRGEEDLSAIAQTPFSGNKSVSPAFAKDAPSQKAGSDQSEESQGWGSWAGNLAWNAAKSTASAAGNVAAMGAKKAAESVVGTAKYAAKFGLAANLTYAAMPVIEEGVALGAGAVAGGLASAVAGPVAAAPAANAAYYGAKTGMWAAGYVCPWLKGAAAAAGAATVTKPYIVDPAIKYGPTVAKTAWDVGKKVGGYAWDKAQQAYANAS